MVFEVNFPNLIVTVCSLKDKYRKNVNFLIPFISPAYNNLVVTKQIYVSPNSENRGFAFLIILQV